MKKQRGFYNMDFTGLFVMVIVVSMFAGWLVSKAVGYVVDHVEISWVSDDDAEANN